MANSRNEEMAIIKDIHVGVRDTSQCICWFTVELLAGGALQIISLDELAKIMEKSQIYKLEDLNGKPCVVTNIDRIIKFRELK